MNKNWLSIALCLLLASSVALSVWTIELFRRTLISVPFVFLLIVVAAIIVYCVYTQLIKLWQAPKTALWTFMISGAALLPFCLLYSNYKFAGKEIYTEACPIAKKGDLGFSRHSCPKPYVIISWLNMNKELIYPCANKQAVKVANAVMLSYQQGLFGFPVITEQRLITQ